MRTPSFLVLAALALALPLLGGATPAWAQSPTGTLAAPDLWVSWVARAGQPAALFQRAFEPSPGPPENSSLQPVPLDPPKALLLSMLIPGASQMRDRKFSGFVMLGAEAGAWFAYQALRSGGHDRQDSSERMAQSAYSVGVYKRNAAAAGENPAKIEENATQLADWFEHSPSDYYDAIGRDADFVYGWSDWAAGVAASTQRDTYLKRRDDGNRLLKGANTVLSGLLVNHIVSAFDAFRSAKKLQRQVPMGFLMSVHLDPFSGRASVGFARHLW